MNLRKLTANMLIWLVFLATCSLGYAQDAAFETKAAQAILIDAKSGIVFYEKNADDLIPPASMSNS